MGTLGWVLAILGIGLFAFYLLARNGTVSSASGLANSSTNFWGFAQSLIHDVVKAKPSWLGLSGGSPSPTGSDALLNPTQF